MALAAKLKKEIRLACNKLRHIVNKIRGNKIRLIGILQGNIPLLYREI